MNPCQLKIRDLRVRAVRVNAAAHRRKVHNIPLSNHLWPEISAQLLCEIASKLITSNMRIGGIPFLSNHCV